MEVLDYVRNARDFGGRFIDYKMGLLGAGIMGSAVFGINYFEDYDLMDASLAAGKQMCYTFCLGGSFMKMSETFATKIKAPAVAFASAVIIPSLISISATYMMHSKIKATKNPVKSTLPVAAIIPATMIHARNKRKKLLENLVD